MTYRRPISRQRQTSFIKSLTDARETLDDLIEKARAGDEWSLLDAMLLLNRLDAEVNTIGRRAESIEQLLANG